MASRVIGLVEMKARIAAINGAMAHKIDAALKIEAEAIMSASKQIVPVDTGILRSSSVVGNPDTQGNVHRIEMGYGGAASDYAVVVHELLDTHHPVGQAKFLEVPLRAAAPYLLENIARRIALDKS